MTNAALIIWKSNLGDWEFGELRPQLNSQRILAYAVHKPTGETYHFHSGFGCESAEITEEMLIAVCNYLDDYDCSACLSHSVAELYAHILTEMPFHSEGM